MARLRVGVPRRTVANWPSSGRRGRSPAREVKFPPYACKTLANGLQVIAVSHHEQPAVSLRLIVRAGARAGSGRQAGRRCAGGARCSTRARRRRRPSRSPTPIDSIGGAMGTGAGTDLSFINAVVMKDSLSFGAGSSCPTWRSIRRSRRRRSSGSGSRSLSGLQVSYDDPDYLADVVFDRLVYGFHPTAGRRSGTPEIDRRDHARRICWRSTSAGSAPTTRSSPSSAT